MESNEHAQQVATWLATVVSWEVREDAAAFMLVQALAERVERCEHLPVAAQSQPERAQLAALGSLLAHPAARAHALRTGGS